MSSKYFGNRLARYYPKKKTVKHRVIEKIKDGVVTLSSTTKEGPPDSLSETSASLDANLVDAPHETVSGLIPFVDGGCKP